ncbi:acyltransferase [Fluviicola sp.]|uniref:acyltransferase family protein n=1 Tax=Fluviicola sp. TaxID=1917219 RepID=UPI0031DC8763
MSGENAGVPLAARPRLKFIDMARSIAILMMLEGHFTGSALADQYRDDNNWLFSFWHNLHGLTSPLFFAVTGVVFVYLLSRNTDGSYFGNERVKKGFGRVRMLLFWGYLIQFDLITFVRDTYYGFEDLFKGGDRGFVYHLDWFQAFHVLQSIGVGIFLLLMTFGVYKLIKKGPLYLYYLVAALIVFVFYAYLKQHIKLHEVVQGGVTIKDPAAFVPQGAPKFIQNMIYGQFSDFSFVRYSGYVLMGGMIGAIIRLYERNVRKWWFGVTFILVGLLFNVAGQMMFHELDKFTDWIGLTAQGCFENNTTGFARMGQVAMLLGTLMLVDANFKINAPLFLKMGQTTFPVYIVHVIILYAGIIGIGLDPEPWYHHQFSPWGAISISAFFITVFVIMVKYIEPLTELYYKVFGIFYPKRKKLRNE